jgi:hypothetical protein
MNKNALEKILHHPDKDEIISKLVIGIPVKDIHTWLSSKYSNVSESKFVIAEKSILSFKDNYLDIYNMIQDDMLKTKGALATNTSDQLKLAVANNSAYKSKMIELAGKELNIRDIIINLCAAIETRFAQVFDQIQEDPRSIDSRIDRLLIEYANTLGTVLERYYKLTEAPQTTQVVQNNNITVQVVEQHISVIHDIIKDTLAQMDLETSLYFMEVFNERMAKLKPASEKNILNTDERFAEAKLLNESINKKINE